MNNPIVVNGTEFNISCAAVVSKEEKAHYGYYECRFKANKNDTLINVFGFQTEVENFLPTENNLKELHRECLNKNLTFCECIGRTGDFNGNSFIKE